MLNKVKIDKKIYYVFSCRCGVFLPSAYDEFSDALSFVTYQNGFDDFKIFKLFQCEKMDYAVLRLVYRGAGAE